ncbi:hypothetical protein BDK51DRAFT_25731 [Blyttiomyces helicus]|uniref:Uncharacterized protein n=1 Tax=Blyttiomyces helicus TaxID=388810 RepID=A0A4P9W0D2_9FUNG|nr:hypothetical protein BDK51DRAFT_25731 [Blyttiomyces helicus]|eukprot:RKO84553.1 hypothetical protein BDK51DRAFT_25731 [Blyttiomyces helicus]
MTISLYAARQEHLTELSVGNILAKSAWKLALETWKELVEDENNPDTMMSVSVETKHLANKWSTIDKDAKAYIQNGGNTKSGPAAIAEPKYFDLYMGMSHANMELFWGGSQLFIQIPVPLTS